MVEAKRQNCNHNVSVLAHVSPSSWIFGRCSWNFRATLRTTSVIMQQVNSRRMGALAAVVALGLAACVAVVVFNTSMKPVELGAKSQHAHKVHKAMKKGLGLKHSDMSLLASAMADQSKEKHAACLKECTTKDCKKACGALAPGAKAKAAKTMAQARKKGLGLKKGDLSLLKDAQKARHAEEVKHCKACVSAECKANCKATMAAATKSLGASSVKRLMHRAT
jgi:hypothetical protein